MVRLLIQILVLLISCCTASFTLAKAPLTEDDLQISLSLSKQKVWQREQVTINLTIITNDTLARLASDDFEQNGFTVISYDQKALEKAGKLSISKRWVVYPFIAGEQLIKLPRIRYRPNSGRPIILTLPQKNLNVLKLPVYVSPTMPVGKIELESDWNNGKIISSNTLYQWQLTAKVKHVAPQTMPAISRLLHSTESIQILPFNKKIKLINKTTEKGFTQIRYQVPIKAIGLGKLNLPHIAIQYFEPKTGKLEIVRLDQPFVLVLNKGLIGLLGLVFLVLLLYFSYKLSVTMKDRFKAKRLKQDALILLANARQYQQVREALEQYAIANGLKQNITLQQLLAHCEKQGLNSASIKSEFEKLQIIEFSGSNQASNHSKVAIRHIAIQLSKEMG